MDRPMVWFETLGEMMIQLELEFPGPLDADRLAEAAVLTLDGEPVLGCRLLNHWCKPRWQRMEVQKDDLCAVVSSQTGYEAFKHASMDTYVGPQIKICLWNDTNGARLLIKVAHHVADAAGVKDIARVMPFIHGRLSQDPGFRPTPNLTRSENTRNLLQAIPKGERRNLRHQFEEYMKQAREDRNTFRLPIEKDMPESPFYIQRTLTRDTVASLTQHGRPIGATLNDILVSAFFRAQAKTGNWDGTDNLRITTTIDMRRYLDGEQASSVANLSLSLNYWPDLGKDLGSDFMDTLKKVTTATRERKERRVGLDIFAFVWPMVRYVPHGLAMRLVRNQMNKEYKRGNWPDTFTNMGPINPADVTFDDKPTAARLLPPPLYPPYFVLGASGYVDTLTLTTCGFTRQKDLCERFLDAMVAELAG